ncbi:hypothetical protein PGT21_036518 [Puccinia graminis f. sp. tritici]|uniref:Mitochondrial carrier n=1 Tax=Puccinia graminis f. sp. tritici TaxID=56615 RepID=A0A5B0RM60_PUCGR|nr:hypothetical protein PGT21_036518 [Puccinia graminis f. sp. tritici]KAA1126198.1 hypothetical protein PGTUg99_012043 [Puccinia graminis f. sp. tritici]
MSEPPNTSSLTRLLNHQYLPDPRGFLAGVLSGLTKLAVGHPFDTIKLRIQCAPLGVYHGPMDCFLQTIRKEGPRALYKGASPPAVGWALSDAVLMGSLDRYRSWLGQLESPDGSQPLSLRSHAIAGSLAGWTVCSIVTPIETIKAKLQMQTSDPRTRLYTGPIDCARQIVGSGGPQKLYRALPATLLFRTCFAVMFSSYYTFNNLFQDFASSNPSSLFALTPPVAQFLAGGLAAEAFWLVGYPLDMVKNRIMCDSFIKPRYPTWISAARAIWLEGGFKAFYRGLTPCILRAFPTNAAALAVWEGAMKVMKT